MRERSEGGRPSSHPNVLACKMATIQIILAAICISIIMDAIHYYQIFAIVSLRQPLSCDAELFSGGEAGVSCGLETTSSEGRVHSMKVLNRSVHAFEMNICFT